MPIMKRKRSCTGAVPNTGGPTDPTPPVVRVEELYRKTLSPCNSVIEIGGFTCALFP